ncbi:MAG: CDP-alcohol phosphatidyltransferase family protein [Alphaproteobacteria bacterium]|jgi:phosphatidylglycerophosphate synthase|nr:CDP-alcohol phosphatidyltransferase family protein [Alphaproteobacteria bacterium]
MTVSLKAGAGGVPYDQRLAGLVVRPLAGTPIHPNHLTVLSIAFGLTAAGLFAFGDSPGWAATLFMLGVFTDHTDGELARLTAKTSRFGHHFDYIAGAANYTALFVGLGIGLDADWLAGLAPVLGVCAGLANPLVMGVRLVHERRHGDAAVAHPYFGGFELEDFIYLIGPITWLGGLDYFFLVYGLGAIGYLLWQSAMLVASEMRG